MMLTEFVTWWSEQMRGLVPARARGGTGPAGSALIVDATGDAAGRVSLTLRRGGRARALGPFGLEADRARLTVAAKSHPALVVLRLPQALLLTRDAVLPLAAERDPARVLAYEMDRLTPFAPAEVFWSYTVQRRDRANGRLHLRLTLVTRASVEPVFAALARAGIRPTVIEAEAGTPRIDLRGDGARDSHAMRVASRAMAVACCVLALAAMALPFARQRRESAQVEARIAALRPQVEAAEAARRRIAASVAGVDVIAAERMRLGDALTVLAALTDVLPDDTSLTDLALNQGRLTLNGQSASAAKLIGALSANAVIRNPDFAAPVTRVANGGADLFAIRAEVAR